MRGVDSKTVIQLLGESLANQTGTKAAALKLIPVNTDDTRFKKNLHRTSHWDNPEFRSLFVVDPNDPMSFGIAVDAGLLGALGGGTASPITSITITATGQLQIAQGTVINTLPLADLISATAGNAVVLDATDNKLYVKADVTYAAGVPTAAPAAGMPMLYQDTATGNFYAYVAPNWVNMTAATTAISTYDAGNGVTVTGTAGITAGAVAGGKQIITIPAGGELISGHTDQLKAAATNTTGSITTGFVLEFNNSANGINKVFDARVKTYTGTVSSANKSDTAVNPTVQQRMFVYAGGVTDIVLTDIIAQSNSGHDRMIITFK